MGYAFSNDDITNYGLLGEEKETEREGNTNKESANAWTSGTRLNPSGKNDCFWAPVPPSACEH